MARSPVRYLWVVLCFGGFVADEALAAPDLGIRVLDVKAVVDGRSDRSLIRRFRSGGNATKGAPLSTSVDINQVFLHVKQKQQKDPDATPWPNLRVQHRCLTAVQVSQGARTLPLARLGAGMTDPVLVSGRPSVDEEGGPEQVFRLALPAKLPMPAYEPDELESAIRRAGVEAIWRSGLASADAWVDAAESSKNAVAPIITAIEVVLEAEVDGSWVEVDTLTLRVVQPR